MDAIFQVGPSPKAADQIFHLRAPALPEWRFEWHQASQRVFVLATTTDQPIGEPIAARIADERAARAAVSIWCHGYRTAGRALPTKRSNPDAQEVPVHA